MGKYKGHLEHNRRIQKLALIANNELFKQRVLDYNLYPKICKNCNASLPYEKRTNIFCNRRCSATFNNKGVVRNKKVNHNKKCKNCQNKLINNKHYCNVDCFSKYKYKNTLKKHLNEFKKGRLRYRKSIYNVLKHLKGNKCSECKVLEWNGKELRLRVDHIDGNPENNSPKNLRLLCPNCDSLTNTYCGRNYGNGRGKRGLPTWY